MPCPDHAPNHEPTCRNCNPNTYATGTAATGEEIVPLQRLARLRALMVDRSEEVTNHIGGVIGYRIHLNAEDTRRVFELLDGVGTEPSHRICED